jgi:hypothetical protein
MKIKHISRRDSLEDLLAYLLLEVTSILFVDEDEVEIIPGAELLVHVSERRR